ncbi:hypothetical protein VSH64_01920 [Amycolatopsis rhabdoformis]|uniref:Uncharacterized protein n=1 Tax=Amycolatopsis rhabdoformis TaxID=1448059 RepID=A0ABZ1I9L8_9PSEU|nr:hypothetical protein [Amycolatopsis rhabdoformis]WSE30892.1 hypothetical protein VSH64_01920 [Amycolatopsis rhabdoformis]
MNFPYHAEDSDRDGREDPAGSAHDTAAELPWRERGGRAGSGRFSGVLPVPPASTTETG